MNKSYLSKFVLIFFLLVPFLKSEQSVVLSRESINELEEIVEELWDNVEFWAENPESFHLFRYIVKERIKEMVEEIQKIKLEILESYYQ